MNQGIKQKKRKPERKKIQACKGFEPLTSVQAWNLFFQAFFSHVQKVAFLTVMIFFHLILYPEVHIYDFHIFTTSLSSFHGFRIPYKPEFFFRLSFRNFKSCVYNCDDLLSFKLWYSSLPCSSYHLRREFSRISHFYNFFFNWIYF